MERLKDLINQNLSELKFKICYSLKLKHGLMGYFPAIIGTEKQKYSGKGECEIILCSDINVMKKVWDELPNKEAELKEIMFLVNEKEGYGFSLESPDKIESKKFPILTEERFFLLKNREEKMFHWAPGLFGGSDGGWKFPEPKIRI